MGLETTRPARGLQAAFTLVELLIVISVITILAGIIVPLAIRGHGLAHRVAYANNLSQIGVGLGMYSNAYYRIFPPNQPYPYSSKRSTNPWHGDDDQAPLYNGKFIPDLHAFNCPSTTDNAQDYPTALPPRVSGEDIKWKRSDPSSGTIHTYATQLSYEYLGEYNPGQQYADINTRIAVVAHDDDGLDYVSVVASGDYSDTVASFVANGRSNHRGAGGNMLFLDRSVEWVPLSNWKQRLIDGIKEWYRVTGWHLRVGDKS